MLRLILIQLAATLVTATLAGLIAGVPAFISAMLGGLCCVVPNGLFALRLFAGAQRPGTLSPMTFFFGEFTKIAMTVALLALAVWWYRDLNWLALLAAFIVALKSYIILLFRH
jgi:ATP synthase protein I